MSTFTSVYQLVVLPSALLPPATFDRKFGTTRRPESSNPQPSTRKATKMLSEVTEGITASAASQLPRTRTPDWLQNDARRYAVPLPPRPITLAHHEHVEKLTKNRQRGANDSLAYRQHRTVEQSRTLLHWLAANSDQEKNSSPASRSPAPLP